MTPTVLLAVVFAADPGVRGIYPPIEYAVQAFGAGRRLSHNAPEARKTFAAAAARFDQAWRDGSSPRTPALALNRGHAHFLAGDLPRAILAFHDGLALAPTDAELQQSLTAARATIPYPDPVTPAERVRPDPPRAVRNRVAPWDLYRLAAVSGVLIVVGSAKRLTTRPGWAVPVAALGGLGWLTAAGVGYLMHRERLADEANPVAVVAPEGVALRTGNGESYPPRTEAKLPRGTEVRVVGRRGGWAQVELPGGAVGWLPEAVLMAAR